MSPILNALAKLEQSIGSLEGAAAIVERNLAEKLPGQQRDMFGGSPAAANGNGIDADAVVKTLDNAIAQVESVLQEGRG